VRLDADNETALRLDVMADIFDAYHKWLGVPREEQPPNHYRLLGLSLFEHDADVIESAADKAMVHVRSFQNGKRAVLSQEILTELASARLCLLDIAQRGRYDRKIRWSLEREEPGVRSTPSPPSGADAAELPVTEPEARTPLAPKPVVTKSLASKPAERLADDVTADRASYDKSLPDVEPASRVKRSAPPVGKSHADTSSTGSPTVSPLEKVATAAAATALAKSAPAPLVDVGDETPSPADRGRRKSAWHVPAVIAGLGLFALIGTMIWLSSSGEDVSPERRRKKVSQKETVKTDKKSATTTPEKVINKSTGSAVAPTIPQNVAPTGTTAAVEMLRSCDIAKLRRGAALTSNRPYRFVQIDAVLRGMSFARNSYDNPLGPSFVARSSGVVYLIVHAGSFPEGELQRAGWIATPLRASVASPDQSPQSFSVLQRPVSALQRYEVPRGKAFPPLLVTKKISIKRAPLLIVRRNPKEIDDVEVSAGIRPGAQGKAPAPSQGVRRKPPSKAEQLKVRSEVDDLFDVDKARSFVEQWKLAKKIYDAALETKKDPVAQYVMIRTAIDLLASSGYLRDAQVPIRELGKRFEIDEWAVRTEAFQRTLTVDIDVDEQIPTLRVGLQMVDDAVRENRYDVARTLSEAMLPIARKVSDRNLLARIVARRKQVLAAGQLFAEVRAALIRLKTKPNDPTANLAAGRYYCLAQGDWATGLPMLAKGSDPAMKSLAKLELARPAAAKDQVRLADAWIAAGALDESLVKDKFIQRAVHWYRRAVSSLTGLDRIVVKKKIEKHTDD
jgi:hypothetical protein